jgi:hypothetical protein
MTSQAAEAEIILDLPESDNNPLLALPLNLKCLRI